MTGYFDDAKNVEAYIKMAEGYDGRELIEILKTHLDSGAKVLELGMGPGKDYTLLGEHYQATGSDNSAIFVERYRQQDAQADVVVLDAVTMAIERKFDGIYGDKAGDMRGVAKALRYNADCDSKCFDEQFD